MKTKLDEKNIPTVNYTKLWCKKSELLDKRGDYEIKSKILLWGKSFVLFHINFLSLNFNLFFLQFSQKSLIYGKKGQNYERKSQNCVLFLIIQTFFLTILTFLLTLWHFFSHILMVSHETLWKKVKIVRKKKFELYERGYSHGKWWKIV